MAARVVCYSQFLSCCWARRILKCRPLTRISTIAQQRTSLTSCREAPRLHTWCFRDSLRGTGGCRSFSLSETGDDFDNSETSVSKTYLNSLETTDDSDVNFDDEARDGSETHLNTSDLAELEQDSSNPHVDNTVDITELKSELPGHETGTGRHEDSSPTNHQPNRSSTDADVTEQDKRGTLDLSNLTWSDDGIVIYPEIQFGTKKEKDKPMLTPWKDKTATAKMQDCDIQSLLHNIQKSRLKKEQVVVRERRISVMTAEEMVEFLRKENARDIVVIELPPEVDYVRYFIVCSGMGSRHIGRMADNLVAEVRPAKLACPSLDL